MSAQPSTFERPAPPFTVANARNYRKTHQQTLHVINRILHRLSQASDMAARAIGSATPTIHGLHGMMNGQDLPIFRAHKWTARQMNYRGSDENAGQFMCRRLSTLDAAEVACGRKFFDVRRGGTDEQDMTSYERDYLSEAAEWALVQIKNSTAYKKNPAAAVTDEILDSAVEMLPVVEREAEDFALSGDEDAGGSDLADEWIIKGMWTRIDSSAERVLIREIESGADPVLKARRHAEKVINMAVQLKSRFERERLRAFSSAGDEDEDGESVVSGKNTHDTSETPLATFLDEIADGQHARVPDRPPLKNEGGGAPETSQNEEVTKTDCAEMCETTMKDWALWWAQEKGVPVFPLYEPTPEGGCTCQQGAQCKSAGKHPRTFKGLKEATTHAAQIAAWWSKWPTANIGGATGEASGLYVVDVDPKTGGDASLTDLAETFGSDWLETKKARTGSGGFHLFFTHPEGRDLRNTAGKVAPGIDTRGNGGYVVLAPSAHASGLRYELQADCEELSLPEWLLDRITATAEQPPAKVVNFQERRSAPNGCGSIIGEGERNDRLFKIGCAMWGKGEASDATDLLSRLIEANYTRCSPPLEGAEVAQVAGSITRYTRGVPVPANAEVMR